jgi:predicted dehydrogenase
MANDTKPVRVGVAGLGFMGATHIAAYQAAAKAGFPCRLVAVADRKASRRKGELWDVGGNAVSDVSAQQLAFDPKEVRGHETADALIADPNVDLISICTRTDTHVDLAIKAMNAGKHVLVEKPVALKPEDVRKVVETSKSTGKLAMPAMCMRFWPAWKWLKERIDDRAFGACHSATFQRLASQPNWSPFYSDGKRSGGALVDLHIHDADFVRWCFGAPRSVTSAGRVGPTGAVDHVTTLYHYEKGPAHVVAEGGWDQAVGFAFRMRYVVVFDKATADFDLTRDPQLLLCQNGQSHPVELDAISGYDGEIRHLVSAIASGKTNLLATMEDAVRVTELLNAEERSALSPRGGATSVALS